MYYGVDDSVPAQQDNPLDLDKAGFKSEVYMEKVLKECSLNDLYKQEEKMKKGIASGIHTHTHTHKGVERCFGKEVLNGTGILTF